MEIFCKIVSFLKENQFTISAAESCTGGLFASEIVAIPDASSVLSASFITYSEKAKSRFANVPLEIIDHYGVVSEQTALAMAKGAAENAGADVGVGITGFAGPSGGDSFAEKGIVCFGFVFNGNEKSYRVHFKDKERNEVRKAAVEFAGTSLYEFLQMQYK